VAVCQARIDVATRHQTVVADADKALGILPPIAGGQSACGAHREQAGLAGVVSLARTTTNILSALSRPIGATAPCSSQQPARGRQRQQPTGHRGASTIGWGHQFLVAEHRLKTLVEQPTSSCKRPSAQRPRRGQRTPPYGSCSEPQHAPRSRNGLVHRPTTL